jgi:hypothetical protein
MRSIVMPGVSAGTKIILRLLVLMLDTGFCYANTFAAYKDLDC